MRRRAFLSAGSAMLAACAFPPVSAAAGPERRTLVLVELKGGNDGLNTVVPYAQDSYYRLRPRLAVRREDVLRLDERFGLHPAMRPLVPLWKEGELAIVHGLGYPAPNLSHFRSIEIWDTASKSDEYLSEGWLGRAFRARPGGDALAADGAIVGGSDPGPFAGTGARTITLDEPQQFLRQARLAGASGTSRNAALAHLLKVESGVVQAAARLVSPVSFRAEFPRGAFGQAAQTAAKLAAHRSGVMAIRLSLGGFDTHQNQAQAHAGLLAQLSEGLVALRAALIEAGCWNSTLIMTYAEFGRRPQDNESNGTDHGTAAAHFVLGGRVRGGMHGDAPSLTDLADGNLRHTIDFRRLYATALERWWGYPATAILGGRFEPLDVLRG